MFGVQIGDILGMDRLERVSQHVKSTCLSVTSLQGRHEDCPRNKTRAVVK